MFTTFAVSDFRASAVPRAPRGRACDACRRLKIKCRIKVLENVRQSTSSPCDACREARVKCTYRDKAAKRGRPPKQFVLSASGHRGSPPANCRGRCAPATPREDETLLHFAPSPFSIASVDEDVNCDAEAKQDSQPIEQDFVPGHSLDEFDSSTYRDSDVDDGSLQSPPIAEPATAPDENQAPRGARVEVLATHNVWETINDYYDALYIVFPIVSYSDIASRILAEQNWFSQPDLRALILSLRLLVAAGRYRMDSRDSTILRDLILQVETSRLGYDYADPATLDAVVSSLCLFTAYNVLNLHNRAFLYLDEAISLFNTCLYEEGNPRALRIEKVLFNTEAASQLYAPKPMVRRARMPNMAVQGHVPALDGFAPDVETDAVAARLLERLTRTYVARDTGALVETEADNLDLKDHNRHKFLRIQQADVVVTQQWQLSSKLITDHNNISIVQKRPIIYSLGVQVMSWVCLLREGELRVVGLGKLAELAMNIFLLTGGSSKDILRGLAGAVLREDHEKRYTPKLLNMVTNALSPSIPAVFGVDDAFGMAQSSVLSLTHASAFDVRTSGYVQAESVSPESNTQGQHAFQDLEDLGDLELVGAEWLANLAEP